MTASYQRPARLAHDDELALLAGAVGDIVLGGGSVAPTPTLPVSEEMYSEEEPAAPSIRPAAETSMLPSTDLAMSAAGPFHSRHPGV